MYVISVVINLQILLRDYGIKYKSITLVTIDATNNFVPLLIYNLINDLNLVYETNVCRDLQ